MAQNVNGQFAKSWNVGIQPPNTRDLTSSLKGGDVELINAISELLVGYSSDIKGTRNSDKYRYIVDLILKRIGSNVDENFSSTLTTQEELDNYKETILLSIGNKQNELQLNQNNEESITKDEIVKNPFFIEKLINDIFDSIQNEITTKVELLNNEIISFFRSNNQTNYIINEVGNSVDVESKEDNEIDYSKVDEIVNSVDEYKSVEESDEEGDDESSKEILKTLLDEDTVVYENTKNDEKELEITDNGFESFRQISENMLNLMTFYIKIVKKFDKTITKVFKDVNANIKKLTKNIDKIINGMTPSKKETKKMKKQLNQFDDVVFSLNGVFSNFSNVNSFFNNLGMFFVKNGLVIFLKCAKVIAEFLLKVLVASIIGMAMLIAAVWLILKKPFMKAFGFIIEDAKLVFAAFFSLKDKIMGIITPVFDYFMSNIYAKIMKFVNSVFDLIKYVFNAIKPDIETVINKVIEFGGVTLKTILNFLKGVGSGMQDFGDAVVLLFTSTGKMISNFIDGIKTKTSELFDKIKELGGTFKTIVSNFIKGIDNGREAFMNSLDNFKKAFFEVIEKFLKGYEGEKPKDAIEKVSLSIDKCKEKINDFFNAFKSLKDGVTSIFTDFKRGFQSRAEETSKWTKKYQEIVEENQKKFMDGLLEYGGLQAVVLIATFKREWKRVIGNGILSLIGRVLARIAKNVGRKVVSFFTFGLVGGESGDEKQRKKESAMSNQDKMKLAYEKLTSANDTFYWVLGIYDNFEVTYRQTIERSTNAVIYVYQRVVNLTKMMFGRFAKDIFIGDYESLRKARMMPKLIFEKLNSIMLLMSNKLIKTAYKDLREVTNKVNNPKVILENFHGYMLMVGEMEKNNVNTPASKISNEASKISDFTSAVKNSMSEYITLAKENMKKLEELLEETEKCARNRKPKYKPMTMPSSQGTINMALMENN